MRFGISTHLFHASRLDRDHLVEIAARGFEVIELFATRSHFDYRDADAIGRLAEWLADTGLELHSVHAPVSDRAGGGPGAVTYSNATVDAARRQAAVAETAAALEIARRIPFGRLVVHLGSPAATAAPGDNSRAAAQRSADEICRLAQSAGAGVAFEVIPNQLSSADALVSLIERDLEAPHAGICLDFGHAHLLGDVADAVEVAAEHLVATHVHDNHGRDDEHLVPFRGSINWDTALVTMEKIGYDGVYMMELADTGSAAAVLDEARRARERIERARMSIAEF